MDVYEKLINQFENLTEKEKNSLLIYKSRLGIGINYLDNNEDELKNLYSDYQKLLNNPSNLFMKMTVFKDLPLNDFEKFKNYLHQIKNEVEELSTKLILDEDITVFRAVSIKEDEVLKPVSKSEIVSTSIDINKALKFFIQSEGYKHYLYQINLEKGSSVAICPYAILFNFETNQITLTHKTDQQEIILNKNKYEFNESISTTTKLKDGKNINIIVIDAKSSVKNNEITK